MGTHVPSSDGALGILPSCLRISSRLGPKAKDTEAEKGRENLGDGLSQQKHFQSGLSEFSCGNKDKCPSYALWFSLPWEPPLCESPSFPFSGLPIPGLIQWSALRMCGRVLKAATLASLLPCFGLQGRQESLDINSFGGGSSRGTCLYDIVEIYLKVSFEY